MCNLLHTLSSPGPFNSLMFLRFTVAMSWNFFSLNYSLWNDNPNLILFDQKFDSQCFWQAKWPRKVYQSGIVSKLFIEKSFTVIIMDFRLNWYGARFGKCKLDISYWKMSNLRRSNIFVKYIALENHCRIWTFPFTHTNS